MLIARITIFQSVFTVQGAFAASRSNAVAFFNDPSECTNRMVLPMNDDDIQNYIYFIFPNNNTRNLIANFLNSRRNSVPPYLKCLRVRKEKVLNALRYLKRNNPYYYDITIYDEVNLPDDGIPESILANLQLRVNETNDSIRNIENEDPRQSHILEEVETALNLEMTENSEEVCENTYVESMIRTEMDTDVTNSIRNFRLGAADGADIVIGPRLGPIVNYSNEPRFYAQAFPHLFHDGVCWSCDKEYPKLGGILGLSRYLMKCFNPKFAADPHFLLFMMNSWQTEKTKTQVSFSLYTSFQRWSTALLNISPDELRNENSAAVRRLGATIQNLTKTDRGTNGYKAQGHRQVLAINRELGPPSLFLTLSSPESHCLHTLLAIQRRRKLLEDPSCDAHKEVTLDNVINIRFVDRRNLCIHHPIEVSNVFSKRLESFLYLVKQKKIFGSYVGSFVEIEYQQRGAQHAHMLIWLESFSKLLFSGEEISLDDQKEISNLVDELASNSVYPHDAEVKQKSFVQKKPRQD